MNSRELCTHHPPWLFMHVALGGYSFAARCHISYHCNPVFVPACNFCCNDRRIYNNIQHLCTRRALQRLCTSTLRPGFPRKVLKPGNPLVCLDLVGEYTDLVYHVKVYTTVFG